MKTFLYFVLSLRVVYAKTISYKGIIETDSLIHTQVEIPNYSYAVDRLNQRSLPLDEKYYNGKYTGKDIDVYIIDTGMSENSFYTWTCGFNFIDDNTDCSTTNIHGTHVGSLVKSTTFGIAPKSTVINLKVLDDNGYGYTSDVLRSLDYILHHNITCSIINMSIGGPKSAILNMKIEEVVDAGNQVVVAAGNGRGDACNYSPSSASKAITVGSVDPYDNFTDFTNKGNCVDIYAPGLLVPGAVGKGTVAYMSGTSMSTPFISGLLAMQMERKGCDAKLKRSKIYKKIKIGYTGK